MGTNCNIAGYCSIFDLIQTLVTSNKSSTDGNVTKPQNITFYSESDVKNHVKDYASVKTFCTTILKLFSLWHCDTVFFKQYVC